MPRVKNDPIAPTTPTTGPRLVKRPASKAGRSAAMSIHDRIQVRAYTLFLDSGGAHGHDLEHWLAAERDIQGVPAKRTAAGRATRRAG